MAVRKPKNYLNNKDILKEIHKSKTSYCCFKRDEYHQYDLIIDMPDSPIMESLKYAGRPDVIQEAKIARSNRIYKETGERIDPETFDTDGLIFRVMCWDHIPMDKKQPRKKIERKKAQEIIVFEDEEFDNEDLEDKNSRKEVEDLVHVKVNFPPFQHFRLDDTGNFECVGKSHWKGGVKTGEFSTTHGQLTDKLAHMYMMLCQKYAMKFNWRGYTYNDEMQGAAILQLTYVGLRFNEAKSQNPFAYYTAAITNSFCRVLNTEKRVQNIRDDLLEHAGLNPSLTRQMSEMDFSGDQ